MIRDASGHVLGMRQLQSHEADCRSLGEAVAVAPDGSFVAVGGGRDGAVLVHRTSDGALVGGLAGSPPGPPGPGRGTQGGAVAFGLDGLLYAGSVAGPVRVVDPATSTVLRTLPAPPLSTNQHLAVGRDGVVVGGGNEALVATGIAGVLWTVDLRGTHPDPCPALAVNESGGSLYCGTGFGVVEERDRGTGRPTGARFDPQLGRVGGLAVTPDGRELVAFGGEVAAVSRWRLDGSGPVTQRVAAGHVLFDGWDPAGGPAVVVARRSAGATVDTDFDDFALWDPVADHETDSLATSLLGTGWAGAGTLVGLDPRTESFGWYDANARRRVAGPEVGTGCEHLWASAGGERAYCGFSDGQVWTIDPGKRTRTGARIQVAGPVRSVSATAGGRLVVVTAATPEGPVTTVHDGGTGEAVGPELVGPHITGVSLDGTLVGATGGTVTRYDLGTGEPLADLPGARGEVTTLQFSRDGSVLLTTALDQTVSLIDVASGTRLGDPVGTASPMVYPGYLRPDGLALAVNAVDGVAVWDLEQDHLLRAACGVAGRNLTRTERAAHLPGTAPYRATCPGLPAAPPT